MADMNRRSIKNFLVNPSLQIKYIVLHLWAGAGIVIFNIWSFRRLALDQVGGQNPILNQQLNHGLFGIGVLSAIMVVIFAIVCAILSHRTAGPIYHIGQVIQEIRSGNLDARANVRKNDDFQNVASDFNQMLDEILPKSRS